MNPKILMFDAAFPPPVIGGKEKQAELLANQLSMMGIKVSVISFVIKGSNELSRQKKGVNIKRIVAFNELSKLIKMFAWIFIFRFNHNILHIHTPSQIGIVAAAFGKFFGYKIFFKMPNTGLVYSVEGNVRTEIRILKWLVDVFIVLEEDTLSQLLKAGIKKTKIFYTYNGVEVEMASDVARRISLDSKKKLLYVGRLVPQKGVEHAIMAAYSLIKKGVNVELNIVGDGPLLESLKTLVKMNEIENFVNFIGHDSSCEKYYQYSDILLLPSYKEGMSNVILEAMSYSLPVICTKVGGAAEQLGEFYMKYSIQPGEYNELVNKIEILINDENEYQEYSKYLKSRIQRLFSINKIAQSYVKIYSTSIEK